MFNDQFNEQVKYNSSNLLIVFRWIAFVLFLCFPFGVSVLVIVSAAMETLHDRDSKCFSIAFFNLCNLLCVTAFSSWTNKHNKICSLASVLRSNVNVQLTSE